MKEKYGWIAFLLLSWILIDAILISFWPPITVDQLSLRLRFVSAKSICVLTMLIYFVHSVKSKYIMCGLEIFTVINCISYLYLGAGAFSAGSADMAFMAMMYPQMAFRPRHNKYEKAWAWFLRIFPLSCLFFNRPGSAVFMALALGLFTYLILEKKWKWIIPVPAALLALGYHMSWDFEYGQKLFLSDSGRLTPWTKFMQWWADNANMWIGTGTGTFQWLNTQVDIGRSDIWFTWMHNEFLQVLFEQGVIGLILMLALFAICLKKSVKVPFIFASLVSTAFVFCVHYPIRVIFGQIFVLLLIKLCFARKPNGA